jgi:Flp pilus assembly protein TadG
MSLSHPSRKDRGQDGFYTVIFVIVLPLLLAALGLAVDSSHYWWAEAQLQTAADAAALAGSKDLNSTAAGRTAAVSSAASFAVEHKVDGVMLQPSEVLTNTTGRWDFETKTFTTTNVSDPAANAIRVTVQRQNVPSFFGGAVSQAAASQTISASAIAVAGGAGGVGCAAPLAMAACIPTYDSGGSLICPTALSFQNGAKSVGLTIPDGSSPANGSKAHPFFVDLMNDPNGCSQEANVGDVLYLQDGNDLTQPSVNAINSATNDGANPKSINVAMVDVACGTNGPAYSQSAAVVGFLRMRIVGARWSGTAPALVAAACPDLGKKNVCIVADCTPIDQPAGGTVQVRPERVFLVD